MNYAFDVYSFIAAHRAASCTAVEERVEKTASGCWSPIGRDVRVPIGDSGRSGGILDVSIYAFLGLRVADVNRVCHGTKCVNPAHRKAKPVRSPVVVAAEALEKKSRLLRQKMWKERARRRGLWTGGVIGRLSQQTKWSDPDVSPAERRLARRRGYRERPARRLDDNISAHIRQSFRRRGLKKDGAKWSALGYTSADLRSHIERQFLHGMTWENHGRSGWHVDHIVPLSSFEYTSVLDPDFRAAWALTNLRPMWAEDNIRKGATRTLLL